MSKIKQILPDKLDDKDLLEGLRNGDNNSISFIYKTCFPPVSHMIQNNNGDKQEAKDIFQEAVVVLYDKITHQNFELNSKLSTFLYAVSRRLWLKHLSRRNGSYQTYESNEFEIPDLESDIQSHLDQEIKFDKMEVALQQLGEPCNTILRDFYLKNKSMQEICEKLGYTNSDNVKTQKYKCLQRLKKLFFNQNG